MIVKFSSFLQPGGSFNSQVMYILNWLNQEVSFFSSHLKKFPWTTMLFFSFFFFPSQKRGVWGRERQFSKEENKTSASNIIHNRVLCTAWSPSAGTYGVDWCRMRPGLTRAPEMSTEAITPLEHTRRPQVPRAKCKWGPEGPKGRKNRSTYKH